MKGYNFKATEMMAAFGLVQMQKLKSLRKSVERTLIDTWRT